GDHRDLPSFPTRRSSDLRKATSAGHSLTWVSGDWIHRECPDVFPIWAPFLGDTRGFHTWKNARAVKAGLKLRPYVETAADTLRWYKAQPEGGRTKLAGPASASEAQLLSKWKESKGGLRRRRG